MSRAKKGMLILGVILCVLAVAMLLFVNRFTLKEQVFAFDSDYNGKPVRLEASLYEAENAQNAVLICPGYSCDRQKWEPFANSLAARGLTVMTFDYAGQGASGGTIGFDNAKTDSIPAEIDDAIAVLMEKTGLPEENIILLGHSMGGRSILRLMTDYRREGAETRVKPRNIRNLILISPEVNYEFSAQATLFAGTRDDEQEPWASFSEKDIEGVNVWLFGSTADDVVSDGCILALYERLGAKDIPMKGEYENTQINSTGSRLTVTVTGGVLHSYQMYSPRFAAYTEKAVSEITGKDQGSVARELYLVYASWGLALLGLSLLMAGLGGVRAENGKENLPVLKDPRKFLTRKLLMWLPGLLMAFLVCSICVVIPFGSPIMNIPYMCFIAGYGLVMLLAYRKGHFSGTEGKLPAWSLHSNGDAKKTVTGIVSVVLSLLCVWIVLRFSMYRLMPFNSRLFWLAFAGILMTVGFYVSGVEGDMLKADGAARKIRFLYGLIQYIPLILFVLFYLVIKSYSGLIGQILNVVLMYILFVPLGNVLRRCTGNRLLGALVTAFAFQGFMITSAALIALF